MAYCFARVFTTDDQKTNIRVGERVSDQVINAEIFRM
jgi:hypothetical protein